MKFTQNPICFNNKIMFELRFDEQTFGYIEKLKIFKNV